MSPSSRSSMPEQPDAGEGDVSITREVKSTRRTTHGQEIAMALLDGKVAIITGASKGIGRALSLRFAQEKAAVVCAARSADLVRETAELVGKAGGRAIAVTCDAAKEDDVRRMIAAGLEAFGKITTLINNAGDGGPTKPGADYTMGDWMYKIPSGPTRSHGGTGFAGPGVIKAGGGRPPHNLFRRGRGRPGPY